MKRINVNYYNGRKFGGIFSKAIAIGGLFRRGKISNTTHVEIQFADTVTWNGVDDRWSFSSREASRGGEAGTSFSVIDYTQIGHWCCYTFIISDKNYQKIFRSCKAINGKKYDKKAILGFTFFWRWFLPKSVPAFHNKDEYICSEAVYQVGLGILWNGSENLIPSPYKLKSMMGTRNIKPEKLKHREVIIYNSPLSEAQDE